MDGLEVPQPFAGAGVESEQRIAEEILAMAIRSIEVVAGGSERNVSDAALLVERHLIPVVDAAGGLPRLRGPSLVAELAGVRNGVKHPRQFARAHVVGVDIGRRCVIRRAASG